MSSMSLPHLCRGTVFEDQPVEGTPLLREAVLATQEARMLDRARRDAYAVARHVPRDSEVQRASRRKARKGREVRNKRVVGRGRGS